VNIFQRFGQFEKFFNTPTIRNILVHGKNNNLVTDAMFKAIIAKRTFLKSSGVVIKANIGVAGKGMSVVTVNLITDDLGPIQFTITYDLKTKEYRVSR
jgi:hypothetical protein